MHYTHEDLMKKAKVGDFIDVNDELKFILDHSECDAEVLKELAKNCYAFKCAKAIAEHKACNSEVMAVLIKRMNYTDTCTPEELLELMNLPSVTEEVAEKLCTMNLEPKTIVALVKSGKVNETGLVRIFGTENGSNSEAVKLAVLESPNVTSLVIRALLAEKATNKVILASLDNPNIDDEGVKQIIRACLSFKYSSASSSRYGTNADYTQIMDKVMAHDKVTPELVDECLDSITPATDEDIVDVFIKSPKCSKDAILKLKKEKPSISTYKYVSNPNTPKEILIELALNRKALSKDLINHPNADPGLYLIIIETIKKNIYDFNRPPVDLVKAIIDKEDVSEAILIHIAKSFPNMAEIPDYLRESPKATPGVKLAVLANSSRINVNTVLEVLGDDRFTEEQVIQFMTSISEKNLTPEMLCLFLQYKNATQAMYKAVVETMYSKKKKDDDVYAMLFSKDLSDEVLAAVCRNEENYGKVVQALQHKDAGLKTVAAANTVADKYAEASREEILEAAKETKHRIISSIYHIEEEKNITDVLRRNVERGHSTMLWGPSGVGKSARVFEVDPTATMLILKNNMIPEEIIGGKEPNGEPGEIYPPHWYVTLKAKCEAEPDRKHILFIDEFTNVKDNVKNLAWEIIGNRTVAGHEEWKLPDNCSVVVAGNRPNESSAVSIDSVGGVMPAPLHNRIDSMLEIEFDIDEWQNWALETNPETGNLRIHPIVYSFCIANADKVMFSEFNPQEITQPFLTPRKWERLSDAIYACEKNDPLGHLGPIALKSQIGDTPIGRAFQEHYDRLPMDMEMVMYGKYTPDDFPTLEDKLFALGMVIAKTKVREDQKDGFVDEDSAREFVSTCLGDEYAAIYENMMNSRKGVLEATGKAKK